MKVTIDLSNVDWELLREQKEWLISTNSFIRYKTELGDGLLHLLDDIQDQAAEVLGEEAVFGRDNNECNSD